MQGRLERKIRGLNMESLSIAAERREPHEVMRGWTAAIKILTNARLTVFHFSKQCLTLFSLKGKNPSQAPFAPFAFTVFGLCSGSPAAPLAPIVWADLCNVGGTSSDAQDVCDLRGELLGYPLYSFDPYTLVNGVTCGSASRGIHKASAGSPATKCR